MSIRIFVSCLAAYNNGDLHGAWIDAEQQAEDIQHDIKQMLIDSPVSDKECCDPDCAHVGPPDEDGECPECGMAYHLAEEWMIHDHEGFLGIEISPHEDIETIAALAELIGTMEGYEAAAFAAWYDNDDRELDRLEEQFREDYQGTFKDLGDWAYEYMDSTGGLSEMPDHLRSYFDYEAFGWDAQLGGDIWTREDKYGTHVFYNR